MSSTAIDLPEHRDQVKVKDACLRVKALPRMMEHLAASDSDSIEASMTLIDEADIYVGVFAHRYGYVPSGHDKSITEMEYDRAVSRGIPRLVFLMGDDHVLKARDFEQGDGAKKLDALKERLKKERVVGFFDSPSDLRSEVLHSLSEAIEGLRAASAGETVSTSMSPLAASTGWLPDIPERPEPFIAHPYTLLETHRLVGRHEQLEELTDWVTGAGSLGDSRVLSVVAIGGMGKSALTWTWFNEIAPQEMRPLAGQLWWSFYEEGSGFEAFVTRALAYATQVDEASLSAVPLPDREHQLLSVLDQEPHLVVLDGLERLLVAYARMDAAYLPDDFLEERSSRLTAAVTGLPESAAQSFVGRSPLRKASDPHVGQFLRRLARVDASRILISSRLYPADLQAVSGDPIPGCHALFLPGLADRDALDLWRAFGARGSRDATSPLFRSFDNHPLLIQLLAYEVARFRDAPGDLDAWLAANPSFSPFDLPLVKVQTHVLGVALQSLSSAETRTLRVISAFRSPASMEALKSLLIRNGEGDGSSTKPYANLQELDIGLSNLEDRGLLGWDRRANRYDLHPIVRGVTWSGLDRAQKHNLFETLEGHFKGIPSVDDWRQIETFEDIRPTVELYFILIGLEKYDRAFELFEARIDFATLYRLSANRQRVEMLEALFQNGSAELPPLTRVHDQRVALNALALAYDLAGQPGAAVEVYRAAIEIDRRRNELSPMATELSNLSDALRLSGDLYAAEQAGRAALVAGHRLASPHIQAESLVAIGNALAARGLAKDAIAVLQHALRLFGGIGHHQSEGFINCVLADVAVALPDLRLARQYAERANELAEPSRNEQDMIHALRVLGVVELAADGRKARELLEQALSRARNANLAEQEIEALLSLAAQEVRQGHSIKARHHLEDVWHSAERGPYRLLHADALNVLARVEHDRKNLDEAVDAATQAYQKAWCDGPPYSYSDALEGARQLLRALGAPEPTLEPFDLSGRDPMPEVDLLSRPTAS